MAKSSCPKCQGGNFEVQQVKPATSKFTLLFVQCASCGAVVGALEQHNIGEILDKQGEALTQIAETVGVMRTHAHE